MYKTGDFKLIETRSVINPTYKISITSCFHKEIDSSRSMIPITGEVLPSLSGWVRSDLNSSVRIQKFKSETPFKMSFAADEWTPIGIPTSKIPGALRESIRFATRFLLERKSDLCLGITWFTRVIKVRLLNKVTR